MAKKTEKPSVTIKRIQEIEDIQNRIRKLAEEYTKDFTDPNPIHAVVQKDLKTAADSLDLPKRLYQSKSGVEK